MYSLADSEGINPPNIFRLTESTRMKWLGVLHVWRRGEVRTYRVLMEEPEGKKPLGRRRRR
jgi:hypothetical protein